MWDQTIKGSPPEGFDAGTVYTREKINEALKIPMPQRMEIVPSTNLSGVPIYVTFLQKKGEDCTSSPKTLFM